MKRRRSIAGATTALGVALGALGALQGCAKPRQYGGPISIDEAGFQRRLELARSRGGGGPLHTGARHAK